MKKLTSTGRRKNMLLEENTALVVIDVQGKLADIVHESEKMLENIVTLIKGVQLLHIPIIWLEQYPEGLGQTKQQIQTLLSEQDPIKKMDFSASDTDEFHEQLRKLNREQFLVVGMEAHVCVFQTVVDLLESKESVDIVVDGISSRTAQNKAIAIDRMATMGANKTSVEMALFELMKSANHPKFQEIRHLIK